jgi:preprotein translocase subunit SecA
MAGPFLDPLNQPSDYSAELLEMVTTAALSDTRYVERLEEHYHLVKRAAADPEHPAYTKIRQELSRDEDLADFSPSPPRERVPRNAPCPCGSGKKYKQCCMWKDRRGS